jgi:hypothetical protein
MIVHWVHFFEQQKNSAITALSKLRLHNSVVVQMNRPLQGRDQSLVPRRGRHPSRGCNANVVQPRSTCRGIYRFQSPSPNRRHKRPRRWDYDPIISPRWDALARELAAFEGNMLWGDYNNLDMSIIWHPLRCWMAVLSKQTIRLMMLITHLHIWDQQ